MANVIINENTRNMKLRIFRKSNALCQQFVMREITIPSQFFLAPINTGYATGGNPNSDFIYFYTQRSGHKLGITYVGNVAVGKEWATNSNTPWFSSDSLNDWKKLAITISENGSVPGIQLACRVSKNKPMKGWRRKNVKVHLERVKSQLDELSKNKISDILQEFIDSAGLAIKAGFRVIQIHAAHGYFLSELLDSRLNVRNDRFGADPVSAIHSIVSAIRRIDKTILIDMRLSLVEGLEDRRIEYARKLGLINSLVKTGLDMISLSNGIYDVNKYLIYPPKTWGHAPYINMAVPLALKYPNLLWNIAGNICDIRKLPPESPDNLTFSIARALIADPELIEKSLSGAFNTIRWCTRKGDCHYYSRGKKHIYCPLEPSLNRGGPEFIGKC
jgi:2,4-dienoyl-CoA reductase-like NADH-dependent reductase (Old Yellow Enzyme family)